MQSRKEGFLEEGTFQQNPKEFEGGERAGKRRKGNEKREKVFWTGEKNA